MPRYVAIATPRLYIADDQEYTPPPLQQRSMVVLEDVSAPIATGLLNMNGVQLYRMPDRNPCGFTNIGVN